MAIDDVRPNTALRIIVERSGVGIGAYSSELVKHYEGDCVDVSEALTLGLRRPEGFDI